MVFSFSIDGFPIYPMLLLLKASAYNSLQTLTLEPPFAFMGHILEM